MKFETGHNPSGHSKSELRPEVFFDISQMDLHGNAGQAIFKDCKI